MRIIRFYSKFRLFSLLALHRAGLINFTGTVMTAPDGTVFTNEAGEVLVRHG
jgi:hypothetical protein